MSNTSPNEIVEIHSVAFSVPLHVGLARFVLLPADGGFKNVEECVPTHRVLPLEALEDRHVREGQQHLVASRLQREREIGLRIA
jgi:hypothetical protein